MKLERIPYGTTETGEKIDAFSVDNGSVSFQALTWGATLSSVKSIDRDGNMEELTLGFDELSGWTGKHPHFGGTIGRFANRIGGAAFTLDGKTYPLLANNGPNHLHGGAQNFEKFVWDGFPFQNDREAGVKFSRTSSAGEEGYPGNLDITVTFSLSIDNELSISYEAACDAPTVINMTNHTYWNLDGSGGKTDVLDHELVLHADNYLEVDEGAIPTGKILSVNGTAFDFTSRKAVGKDIAGPGGFDHCFIVKQTEKEEPSLAAEVYSPASGRVMKVYGTQPGIQFYTGNFLNGSVTCRNGIKAEKHSALCLETEAFPDAPNKTEFPSAVLRPGERYFEKTVHHFSVIR